MNLAKNKKGAASATTNQTSIPSKSHPETIKKMFGAIASKYDSANALLSFNLHKYWNRQLVKLATQNDPKVLLDLCAGTGEITYTWLKSTHSTKKAILLDFCPEMLKEAEERRVKGHELVFIEADAQKIPLEDSSVEAITLAYGIRNVQNPLSCFKEAYRVLKPGGTFGILELTEPSQPLLRLGHNFYLKKLLPFMGGLLTQKPEAYRYLSQSIQAFVKPQTLAKELNQAGFDQVALKPLTCGIAHLMLAVKR